MQIGSPFGKVFGLNSILRFSTAIGAVIPAYSVLKFDPALVFDFAEEYYRTSDSATTFESALTTTRASGATMVDSSGTLVTVGINVPRRGHHVWNGSAWVNEGMLVEPTAATNLITYSEDFTDASWYKQTTATLAQDAIGPDGNISSVTLVDSGLGGTGFVNISNTVTVATTTTYTFSAFLKADQLSWAFLQAQAFTTPASGGASFNLSNGTIGTVQAGISATIQNYGNGWYRCSITFTTDSVDTLGNLKVFVASDDNTLSVDLDGTSSILTYGAQFEQGSVPTSYIPTAGATATRATDVVTVPAANLPWPEPISITGNVYDGLDPVNVSGDYLFTPTIPDDGTTKVIRVRWTQVLNAGTRTRMRFRNAIDSADLPSSLKYYNGNGTFEVFIVTSSGFRWAQIELGIDADISDIVLEQINPLAVSIQIDGLMTYADEGVSTQLQFFRWLVDGGNQIFARLSTNDTYTGGFSAVQYAAGVFDSAGENAPGSYSPGINVPFNIASRHGSTFINGAVDGTALTANLTPTALPDLSTSDLQLAYFGGPMIISKFRMWADDLTDFGIAEASEPSTEPSLSLVFDGSQNSFTVFDWSV